MGKSFGHTYFGLLLQSICILFIVKQAIFRN